MATQATTEAIQKSFIAYYGRPADPSGQNFWENQLDNAGQDLATIINDFGTSEEFTSRFGGQDNNTLINNIFQFLFGRDADQAGLDFYVTRLNSSESTLANISLDILNGATNTVGGAQDESIINNKMTTAKAFTTFVELSGVVYGSDQINAARSLLDSIDENPSSVTAGIANAAAIVKTFPEGEEVNFIVGTAANDTLDATLRNDVFSGLEGQDLFRFDTNDSSENLMDKIADFEATINGDRIIFTSVAGVISADSTVPVDVNSALSGGNGNENILATATNGVIALSGSDVNTIDTLAEWFTVAQNAQLVPLDHIAAFAFDGNTYLVQNKANNPNIIELSGITEISSVSNIANAADTIFIG